MRIVVESILGKSLFQKRNWLSTLQGGNKVPILKLLATSAAMFFTSSGCSLCAIRHLPHFGYTASRLSLAGLLQLIHREGRSACKWEDNSKCWPRLLPWIQPVQVYWQQEVSAAESAKTGTSLLLVWESTHFGLHFVQMWNTYIK